MRKKGETYSTVIPCGRGHFERYVKTKKCVLCNALCSKIYREEHKEHNKKLNKDWYQKNKEDVIVKRKTNYRKNPEKSMLIGAKCRAKKNGLEFNLVESDIIIPKYCPVFPEIELVKNIGKPSYNSATLDRIDNNKGYVVGNIKVISSQANMLKRNGNVELFKRLIEYIESSSQEKN
jgi:hypothetical protein